MKTLRRLLSSLLCLLLCAALLPAAAAEGAADNAVIASGSCGEEYRDENTGLMKRYDVRWSLTTGGTLTISGTGRMGWPKETNEPPWIAYDERICAVVIKSGVTNVGDSAFRGLFKLNSATLPASLTELGAYAFCGCEALTTLTIPTGIAVIPEGCFLGCCKMESFAIPTGVTRIEDRAFRGCSGMSAVSLPSGLKSIGEEAFGNCSALTSVTIPSKVTELGDSAFRECTSLTAIKVSSSNKHYSAAGGVLFNKDKTRLIACPAGKSGSYTVPSSVVSIAPGAFSCCRNLGKVTLGSRVSAIPDECFEFAALTGITIPSSVKSIGAFAFFCCSCPSSVTIPASVKSIGTDAFYMSDSLRTLFFMGNAPTIGANAFVLDWNENGNASAFYPASAAGWDKVVQDERLSLNLDWLPCVKPSVETQPKSQTAYPGETVRFTAAANTNAVYQWQYRTSEDGEWKTWSSMTDATLELTAKRFRDGYQFRCKMTNPLGTATTSAATLHVAKPKITTQPKDELAAIGDTVSFTVRAEGASAYQWQYRVCPTGTWRNSSSPGADAATLSVEATSARNGYQFRCRVKNAMGSVYSEAATLTALALPAVTAQPADKAAAFGSTAKFSVRASGKQLSYQWYYRKTPDGSWIKCGSEGATSRTLSVEVMNYHNGYQFRCKVTNPAGTAWSEAATLTAMAAPAVTAQPQSRSAQRGETVSFTVKASGRELSYQWYYRKTPDGSWIKCSSEGATSRTLSVEVKSYHNGYQFRCRITNPVGKVYTDEMTLSVVS